MRKFLLTLAFFCVVLLSQGKITDFDISESGITLSYDFSDLTYKNVGDTVCFEIPGFNPVIGDGLPALPRRIEN